jgi:hypothetical protein
MSRDCSVVVANCEQLKSMSFVSPNDITAKLNFMKMGEMFQRLKCMKYTHLHANIQQDNLQIPHCFLVLEGKLARN